MMSSHTMRMPGSEQGSRAVAVPEAASVQARTPAQRECGSECLIIAPAAQKDHLTTVFVLKHYTARVCYTAVRKVYAEVQPKGCLASWAGHREM